MDGKPSFWLVLFAMPIVFWNWLLSLFRPKKLGENLSRSDDET